MRTKKYLLENQALKIDVPFLRKVYFYYYVREHCVFNSDNSIVRIC